MVQAAQEHFNISDEDQAKKMVMKFIENLHMEVSDGRLNGPNLFAWGHPWRIIFHCDPDLVPILSTEVATRRFANMEEEEAERSRLKKMKKDEVRAVAKASGMPHTSYKQYFHKGKGRYSNGSVNKADIIDGLLRGPMTGSYHQTDAEDVPHVRPVSAGSACAPDDIGVNSVTGKPEEMLYKE